MTPTSNTSAFYFNLPHSALPVPVFAPLFSLLPTSITLSPITSIFSMLLEVSHTALMQIRLTKSTPSVCLHINLNRSVSDNSVLIRSYRISYHFLFSFHISSLFLSKILIKHSIPLRWGFQACNWFESHFFPSVKQSLHSLFFNHTLSHSSTSPFPNILLHIWLQNCWKIFLAMLQLEIPLPVFWEIWDYYISPHLNAIMLLECDS